jgi:hypothetical protein
MPFNTTKATLIHNNKYDYSKVVYVDVTTKVEIVCPTHGSFFQTPKNHIYAKAGCKLCSNERLIIPFNVTEANQIHNNKYDYSNVVYKNTDTKVEIICPLHGAFLQTPYKHINAKCGCPVCKGMNLGNLTRSNTNDFIQKATIVHGSKYNYTSTIYKSANEHISIICIKHGPFLQRPSNHLTGNGCPTCSTNVSSKGEQWISSFNNPLMEREKILYVDDRRFKVDGFDHSTNTIYEYFGKFWHGCPTYTDHTKINPRNHIPFKDLYTATLVRIETFESNGFNVVYEWEK